MMDKMVTDKMVTVIIPNFNGLAFMEPCFAALDRQDCRDFEVLVVDNGSSDGSVEWLKARGIRTIFLETNTGFTGAVNVGIRAAETKYVLLLNNDTEVMPGFVREMIGAIEASRKIFAVSGKMIQFYNRDLMDDAGDMYSLLGWAFQRGVGQSSDGYNREMEVFSACAAGAIYRRAVFDEIGLFDEMHFAYLEDIDVCYRAKIFGYHNRYCPKAVMFHVGSGTSGSKYNSFKVRLAARNNVYLNYKNMPVGMLVVNGVGLILGMVVKGVFFWRIGFGMDYLMGVWDGIVSCGGCRKVRFRWGNLGNYLAVEWELIWGTVVYVWEFLGRKVRKR